MLNRECPKCGDDQSTVYYNATFEQMELKCILCRYEWKLKPLDVVAADKVRQLALGKPVDEVKP